MLVTYQGQPAAVVTPQRIHLAPPFEALPVGDPVLRFVAFMALYARDVETGEQPGPYTNDRAELFARCALIDPAELWTHSDRADTELAEHFGVPVKQVALRRAELGLG